MKSLHPNFQRSKWMISGGFLIAIVGILLPSVCAGQASAPVMPAWYPFEIAAVNLYESGISQESSNPQGALKTLQLALQYSRTAIRDGGGANQLVMHNDSLIARAFSAAQADASRTVDNSEATQKPNNSGNNSARPVSHYIQTTTGHTTAKQFTSGGINRT